MNIMELIQEDFKDNFQDDSKHIILAGKCLIVNSPSNSSSAKAESFNKGYEVNQKWFTQMATPLLIT